MAHTPHDPQTAPVTPEPSDATQNGYSDASDDAAAATPTTGRPRLVEEHHVRGPYGQDELEATDDRGRRWYHLRPDPRGQVDMFGFNYTWWLIWIFVLFVIFLPWGYGWGY
jgi:hypothetical protein